MCPYLSLSRRNPHTVIWINRCTLRSRRRVSCTPTPASTLSTSCYSYILNVGCCWEVRLLDRFLRIFRNICILWYFILFFAFILPYICVAVGPSWCVHFSSIRGGWWLRRGRRGGAATCLYFSFFCAVLFSVMGPRCLWSWKCLSSPCWCPNGIVVLLFSVAPTVGTSLSPDWPCTPNLLASSLSFDLDLCLLWQVFEGRRRWNPRCGCDFIYILINSCGGRRWFLLTGFVAPLILCLQG